MSTQQDVERALVTSPPTPSAAPRLRRAEWTPRRLWRRWRLWVITILNLTAFFIFWEFFANRAHQRDAVPDGNFFLLLPVAVLLLLPAAGVGLWTYRLWRRSVAARDAAARAETPGQEAHRLAEMKRLRLWAAGATALTLLLIWLGIDRFGLYRNSTGFFGYSVNPAFFPKASAMFTALKIGWLGGSGDTTAGVTDLLQDFVIWKNFLVSAKLFAIGVGIAIGLGIPIGLLMGSSKWVDTLFSPYVWTLSSLPRIAIWPVLVLLIGLGFVSQVWVVILTAIFPVVINSWAGVKTTERSLVNAARAFGANRIQVYQKVVLPYTLPFIVTGVQLGISRGLVGVVLAEFLGGASKDGGLGWLVFKSSQTFNSPVTYAALVSLAVLALLLVQGTRWMEARVAPWRKSGDI